MSQQKEKQEVQNNYTMTIDKKTRFVIMYKGEAIKRFWSLSDARNFLDYAENIGGRR